MTKSQEQGDNEYVDAVRREAVRTGRDICAILREWLAAAKRARDRRARMKIMKAQKYMDCRNRRKRRSG